MSLHIFFFSHRLLLYNYYWPNNELFPHIFQVHLVRTNLVIMAVLASKTSMAILSAVVSPGLLVASVNLNWECDCVSRIRVEMMAFAYRHWQIASTYVNVQLVGLEKIVKLILTNAPRIHVRTVASASMASIIIPANATGLGESLQRSLKSYLLFNNWIKLWIIV